MIDFWTFVETAASVAVLSIPFVFTGLVFLHAARVPQWVWVMSPHTQIWWLAGLIIGIPVVFVGVPAGFCYLLKVRPRLARIENGQLD